VQSYDGEARLGERRSPSVNIVCRWLCVAVEYEQRDRLALSAECTLVSQAFL
jgi:hypothetical protein